MQEESESHGDPCVLLRVLDTRMCAGCAQDHSGRALGKGQDRGNKRKNECAVNRHQPSTVSCGARAGLAPAPDAAERLWVGGRCFVAMLNVCKIMT